MEEAIDILGPIVSRRTSGCVSSCLGRSYLAGRIDHQSVREKQRDKIREREREVSRMFSLLQARKQY